MLGSLKTRQQLQRDSNARTLGLTQKWVASLPLVTTHLWVSPLSLVQSQVWALGLPPKQLEAQMYVHFGKSPPPMGFLSIIKEEAKVIVT